MKISNQLKYRRLGAMVLALGGVAMLAASNEVTPASGAQANAAKPSKTAAKGVARVVKTEAEWKKILTAQQFNVLRKKGTEAPYSGDYQSKKKGTYHCAGCNLELFASTTKFDSGTGWPSFWKPIEGHIKTATDHDGTRVEVLCARCDGHLGHVFDDGPKPTGLRYCMNAVALKFVKK